MKSSARNIELKSVDDLFATEESRADAQREKVQEIPLGELHPFRNHPFKVKDDAAMQDTVDSVREYGVLVPAIARPDPDGGYELIAGHRRHYASELAGKETMPVIVRDLDDDAATIIMVDSNLQREELLPSERAFAYKMKMEAMKRQGSRGDLTSCQNGTKFRTDQLIASEVGESPRNIQRYIRLTELIPDLLELVDKKKLPFTIAVEISYIDKKIQQWLYEYIRDNGFIKPKQISALREHLKTEKINQQQMITLLNENMPGRKSVRKVTLSEDRLSKYFPPFYSQDDMEKVLIQLLEIWKQNQTQDDE